jgi:cell wall-associated NlpC family hydrolase
VTGFIALLGVALVPTSPSAADPDIDDVRARVERLYHQAEQAAERHNDARLQLAELEKDLAALKADEAAQRARVDDMQDVVDQAIAAQYEGQGLSASAELVLSDDPAEFLVELTTIDAYNEAQAAIIDDYVKESEALEIRREATQARADEVAAVKRDLAHEKATAERKAAEAKALLDRLEEKEQEEYWASVSRGDTTRLPANVPVSGRAGAAVRYALAQVGDAYVYGAAGPSAFDCSGLTMMAWAQAGVGLPHSSGAQMGYGARVSQSDLQPGDLVFYYSPVSHVGLYIGGGRIVHAANPGTGVVISPVFSMPYSGAVRPG